MGCGGSKLDPEHEAVPARFRPILRRRLEEIRARRGAAASNNANGLSKKELLSEGAIEGHNSVSSESNSPDASFHRNQDCPPIPQKITMAADPNPSSSLSYSSVSSPRREGDVMEVVVDKEVGALDGVSALCGGIIGNRINEKVENESEEEGKFGECVEVLEEEEMLLVPGSPSFRVYCTESSGGDVDNMDDNEDFDGDNDADHNIVEGQRMSTSEESISSNEVSVKHTLKKGKKGTMFKKMMPKGGKNIFNMQSFYNFPCSSDNSHLLQKAAA